MRQLKDYMSLFEAVYTKYLYITKEDLPILKLLLGSAVSQHLGERTELFWLVLIGPSAAAKTTMLNPFLTCDDLVISRDDCTGNAMISASDPEGLRIKALAKGEDDVHDPSLVNMLDGKLFIVKDLTILLNRKDESDKFWGHMRAAYDGRLQKHSGTIGYQGKESIRYGFIGATTDGSIEGSLVRMSKLGERAIYIRMQQECTTKPEDRGMGYRMLENRGTQHLREKDLSEAVQHLFRKAIRQVKRTGPSEPSMQDKKILFKVVDLASALAKLRTAPMEDSQLPHERNARIVKQFGTICDSVAICSGRRVWTESEVALCQKVVRGSLPTKLRLLLDYVATCSFFSDPARHPTATTAARAIGAWRASNVENQLRQWVSAGLLTYDKARRYTMRRDTLEDFIELGVVLKPRTLNVRVPGKPIRLRVD